MQLYGFCGEGGGDGPIRCLRDRRCLCGWGGGDRYVRSKIFHDFYDPIIRRRCVEYRIYFVLCATQISRPSVYHDTVFIIYAVCDKSRLVYPAFNHLTFYNTVIVIDVFHMCFRKTVTGT